MASPVTEGFRIYFKEEFWEALDDNKKEQLQVYMEAFELFLEREAKYQSLWMRYGAMDSYQHMRSKMARSQFLLEGFTDDQDDPFDLINYTAFFLRNLRAGRVHNTASDGPISALDRLRELGFTLVFDQEVPPGEMRVMNGDECVATVQLG